MVNRFTQKAQDALNGSLELASELGHGYIGTEHLLLSLAAGKDSIAARILLSRGASDSRIKKAIIGYMGMGAKSNLTTADMTPKLRSIIESAAAERIRSGTHFVGTEHLLYALLSCPDSMAYKLLDSDGIHISDIKSDLSLYLGMSPARTCSHKETAEGAKKSKKNVLSSYAKDLTALALSGKTDPVLCRSQETERLIRILCRRQKNNPCLVGEPGVGKTAVVEGLAARICAGLVPPELLEKRIFTLDIPSMLAGAKYRGEFEDRLKSVIEQVAADGNIILFADEMHTMVGAGSAEGAIDASNILKPALSRGEIRLIGATTPAEYRNYIEKDPAFERRFQIVKIEEPTPKEAAKILCGLRQKYQEHHGVCVSDGAIDAAVSLSIRYIHDRFLPDKAIDLIDEACARLRLSELRQPDEAGSLEAKKESALLTGDMALACSIGQRQREAAGSSVAVCNAKALSPPVLLAEHIADVVSEQTGVPCSAIESSESARLAGLEDILNRSIIGQEEAVHAVASAVRRGRVGLSGPHRPVCSFIFFGSTGVGKSEMCAVLSRALFDSESALIRLDMSEYMEKHSVSKLIGAPPGYVGYREGGLLTEQVRRHPYSVILFDEIEKAHPDIFDLLLQILEDATLRDSLGRSCDFSNCIIIMTSNLISESDLSRSAIGFGNSSADGDLRTSRRLLDFFKPEFLNRVDELIVFKPLGEQQLQRISELMLDDLCQRTAEAGFELITDNTVAPFLTDLCRKDGYELGARPLRRTLVTAIEAPLSEFILSNGICCSTGVHISILATADRDGIRFSISK